ncbi:lyase family protein [Burkholderia sp. F1]|uniref:lyase family protein n=1 Tax=Burkholderia sp. F1 TaxID=3366817 RepID=UPI003D72FC4F
MAATFIVKTFVFIESNTTGTGRLCLQKARLRGFDVLFVTSRPQLYPFLQEEMVVPLVADTSDAQRIVDALAPYPGIAGIFSTSEYYIEIAATVATRFGLPAADPEAIRTCRDKGRLHRCLRDAGVGAADTAIVSDRTQLRDLARSLTYPRVLKPAFGSGSVGVRLVQTQADMLAHGDRILDARSNERGIAVAPQLLVQSFVEGPEFSVEVVGLGAEHGYAVLGVTGKHLGPLPHFVECGHDFPAPISAAQRDAIVAETLRALDAAGHRFGPAHVECRVSGGKVVVIEINPRLAGGMIPQAVECATGVDVLGAVIDLHAGTPPDLGPRRRDHAAIRFVLPARRGELKALSFEPDERFPAVRMRFMPLKQPGQRVEPAGDFRDRLAVVIASAADPDALARALEDVERRVTVVLGDADAAGESMSAGRLRRTLHPEALAIVRKPAPRAERLAELGAFAAIDEAHLLMLVDAGICDRARAATVLAEIARQRDAEFAAIADAVAPRGAYALYEQLIIERVGIDAGGAVHTARSRNDINACVAKLRARDWFDTCGGKLWRVRAAIVDKAQHTLDWPLPTYSQYQAAQPGSFGYYLWSVETALRRDQAALERLDDELAVCPLGAGAGAGTDFPIRPEVSAALLGFARSFDSALDAVASRDLVLHFLAAIAIASTTLSRLAHDLQLWTMRETDFLALPDELSGGSSLMPQKKNPYLLEIVKGKLAHVAGALNAAVFASQRTPFSNSVEIGTEMLAPCADAVQAFGESCDLLRLMVSGVTGDPAKMRAAAEAGLVTATQVANTLVRETDISFHAAHRQIGALITQALDAHEEPAAVLGGLVRQPIASIDEAAERLVYGGGPGAAGAGLARSRALLRQSADRLWRRRAAWHAADAQRRVRVADLLAVAPA